MSSHPSMGAMEGPEPSFNALPVELKHKVLQEVQDLDCLEALVKSSSGWHKAYLGVRAQLRITLPELSQDGADPRDALAALWSSTRLRTTERNYRENVIAFLDKWRRADETRHFTLAKLSLDECIEMKRLRRMVDRIIEDIILEMHRPGDIPLVVSESERRRFRRAIYRWHLHCAVFHGYDGQDQGGYYYDFANANAFKDDEREALFFAELSPWESEEVVTVTDYAERRYREFLGQITAEMNAADPRNSLIDDPDDMEYISPTVWHRHNQEFVTFEDKVNWLPVLGPRFLHRILNAVDRGSRTALLMDNYNYTPFSFDIILGHVALHASFPTTWNVMWQNRAALLFESDGDAKSPNLGWVMARKEIFTAEYAKYRDTKRRQFGYVMWDSGRFNEDCPLEANRQVRLSQI
ncbi:hypothetical protein G7Y79_00033g068540 [Physcia stellaris]|nr:hypothetical protein G7Y79_00033g068540 [Physcia stellaris]